MSDVAFVDLWDQRARAYEALLQQHPIFGHMAARLAAELPESFAGQALDLGSGTGLLAESILQARPLARVTLLEPAAAMLEIARQRLAAKPVRCLQGTLDTAVAWGLKPDAILSSAVMQLLDERKVLAEAAQLLPPGGRFIFNLWWHAWAPSADWPCWRLWQAPYEQVLREAGLWQRAAKPLEPAPPKNPRHFFAHAHAAGLSLVHQIHDEDVVDASFPIDFQAMSAHWPVSGLDPSQRQQLLTRLRQALQGQKEQYLTHRFVFERMV